MMPPSLASIEVIAPNLNRRLSGVTSTIVRLVPLQRDSMNIVSFGVGLPTDFPKLSLLELIKLNFVEPCNGTHRIWHARRNVEMLLGLVLKHIPGAKLKLVFTSASQRNHSGYSKFLIRQMDHVIATSKATESYLEVPASVVYHGINIVDFQEPTSKANTRKKLGLPDLNFVGCIGRIRAQKGTDVFVDAMLQLLPDRPDWGAVVLGRATEQHVGFLSQLKNKVRANKLQDRIIFPDEVPVDQIAAWYQALDLFIAPQRWEGFGLTPLESMACGVPVVATKVGAFPEIVVEGETGTLIDPGSVSQMTRAARNLIDAPKTLQGFGKNARKHMIENFDIRGEASRLVEIYQKVLKNP